MRKLTITSVASATDGSDNPAILGRFITQQILRPLAEDTENRDFFGVYPDGRWIIMVPDRFNNAITNSVTRLLVAYSSLRTTLETVADDHHLPDISVGEDWRIDLALLVLHSMATQEEPELGLGPFTVEQIVQYWENLRQEVRIDITIPRDEEKIHLSYGLARLIEGVDTLVDTCEMPDDKVGLKCKGAIREKPADIPGYYRRFAVEDTEGND